MPNVMAALPCSCRHLWKFRIRHKVWLTPTDGVPCSNTANIAKRKTWTQSEFCTLQNSVRGQEPPKVYIVPAQETAKHPAKFGWPPLSDVGAVTKWRRETGWNLLGCPKLPNRSQPLVGRSSSGVTRVFGARGQKQWSRPPPLKSRHVSLTPTVRFLVKYTTVVVPSPQADNYPAIIWFSFNSMLIRKAVVGSL